MRLHQNMDMIRHDHPAIEIVATRIASCQCIDHDLGTARVRQQTATTTFVQPPLDASREECLILKPLSGVVRWRMRSAPRLSLPAQFRSTGRRNGIRQTKCHEVDPSRLAPVRQMPPIDLRPRLRIVKQPLLVFHSGYDTIRLSETQAPIRHRRASVPARLTQSETKRTMSETAPPASQSYSASPASWPSQAQKSCGDARPTSPPRPDAPPGNGLALALPLPA